MAKTRIMYIELKTGFGDSGPAWISKVKFSKTGQSLYFQGKTLQKAKGGGLDGGNYFDTETGEYYWVSGPKKNQQDRHYAGGGPVEIDPEIYDEYLKLIKKT